MRNIDVYCPALPLSVAVGRNDEKSGALLARIANQGDRINNEHTLYLLRAGVKSSIRYSVKAGQQGSAAHPYACPPAFVGIPQMESE